MSTSHFKCQPVENSLASHVDQLDDNQVYSTFASTSILVHAFQAYGLFLNASFFRVYIRFIII